LYCYLEAGSKTPSVMSESDTEPSLSEDEGGSGAGHARGGHRGSSPYSHHSRGHSLGTRGLQHGHVQHGGAVQVECSRT
jgi:hypothetical protein